MIAPHYRVAIDGLVAPRSVLSFRNEGALRTPYRFMVDFIAHIPAIAAAALLGQRAWVTLNSSGLLGAIFRPIAGEGYGMAVEPIAVRFRPAADDEVQA